VTQLVAVLGFRRQGYLAALLACSVLAVPRPAAGQKTPVTFVGVVLDDDYRRADEKLRRYLGDSANVDFASEPASEYGTVIDRLASWTADRGVYLARVTPYALVAAELLGADVQVLATYVSRATGQTTYASYLVVNRDRFPREPALTDVVRFIREAAAAPTFCYHSEFSTSSYFLPAVYFRRNDIFDMPARTDRASAIRTRLTGSGSGDLVRAVAAGSCDIAAVWSGTRASFREPGSSAAQVGERVYFVALPTALPNDLLVASAALDSATVTRIRAAIGRMGPTEVDEGDFLTWKDIGGARDARESLAALRQLARETPAPATVDVRRSDRGRSAVPESYLKAARSAVRLSGLELVNYDRDFHVQQDYIFTLESVHDGAVRLRSTTVGSGLPDQEFTLSFRDVDELTGRIVEFLRTRLHRIRYLWPYRTNPPTVLRDVDFVLSKGVTLTVRKIRWSDPHRNEYTQDAQFAATVAVSDPYKFVLSPSFVDPPDRDGFAFNPMSNISYRVVLARQVHERTIFRALTAALVLLFVIAGIWAVADLRRLLRDAGGEAVKSALGT
jgi:ABC-type phosphate/phosphonate transport system substrate-binding protein